MGRFIIASNSAQTAEIINNGGYHTDSIYNQYAHVLGVESWPRQHQLAAVSIAMRAYKYSFKHTWHDDCVSISWAEFIEAFNGNRPRIKHVQNKILTKPHEGYSKKKGISKAYLLQPAIRSAIETMNRKRTELHIEGNAANSVINDSNGKRVKRIVATRKKEIRAGSLHNVPAWCPVNMKALRSAADAINKTMDFMDGKGKRPKALRTELDSISAKIKHSNDKRSSGRTDKEIMRDYLSRVQSELVQIIELASSEKNFGYMPHQYTQSAAGRWYATGPTTLQNCTKLARNAALSGFYSFDVESCHHAIVLQIAQSMGLPCVNLDYYVSNKKHVREQIAETIGAPVSSVKASLIAMIYGAGLNPVGAISKELTPEKLTLALGIPTFAGLHEELDTIFQAMLKHSSGAESGEVVNVLGLAEPFSRRKDDQRRLAAHLLQGIESQALQAVLKAHGSAVLPLHDGWVCLKPESHTKAEQAIEQDTGFQLQVNEPETIKLSGL